jgi:hypothetical protein
MNTKTKISLAMALLYAIIFIMILLSTSSCNSSVYDYAYNSPTRPYNTSCGVYWNKQPIKKQAARRMASFRPSNQR